MILDKKKFFKIICFLIFLNIKINQIFGFQFFYTPYLGKMKEIKTENFIIIFPEKDKEIALRVASYSEEIHLKLKEVFKWQPYEKTTIILSDTTDFPNGLATPIPRNTIILNLSHTELSNTLKEYHDPIYSLLVHEYTHILHIDQIRGGAWFWRVLFGKLYFPNSGTFNWYIEGVAVLSESIFSEGGRLNTSYNEAFIRNAVLNKTIPKYGTIIEPIVDWPHESGVYHYGARFCQYLYEQYGEQKFKEIFIDISDDFWPFVLLFVMKFKKIYNKSLNELWDEWIKFEEQRYSKINISDFDDREQLSFFEGKIQSFDIKDDNIYIASSSYKNDKYLYQYDGKKFNKIINSYIRNVSTTNDDKYILYTKNTTYNDGYNFFDLFSYNLQTKREYKLTRKKRINYVDFSKNHNIGVFVSHNSINSRLFKFSISNGRIDNQKEIILPSDLRYVDYPSINNLGNKAIFSAKNNDGIVSIYVANLSDGTVNTIYENIICYNLVWIDNDCFSFIMNKNKQNAVYKYSISEDKIYILHKPIGNILYSKVYNDKLYYIDYTHKGEELFVANLNKKEEAEEYIDKFVQRLQKQELMNTNDYKIKDYNFGRYLYPSIWAILPAFLNSSFSLSGFSFPYIAPSFMILNTLPLGRFSYSATITFDYIKLYPQNSFGLNFKLPNLNIDYYWNNWMGGSKIFIEDKFYSSGKKNGKFPICFSNQISFISNVLLEGKGLFFISSSVYHQFEQFDSNNNYPVNKIIFSEKIGYQYIVSRIKTSRWDKGVSFSFNAYQSPNILNNIPMYLIRTDFNFRVPFHNVFHFTKIEGGLEVERKKVFFTDAPLFSITDSIIEGQGSLGLTTIDTKSFSTQLKNNSVGFAFVSMDNGFDITVYKKTHYFYFATMGFKEFFIRIFNEALYLFNFEKKWYSNVLFDIVLELTLDLFLAYGKILVRSVLGGSIGYRVGDKIPSWGVYFFLNFALNY